MLAGRHREITAPQNTVNAGVCLTDILSFGSMKQQEMVKSEEEVLNSENYRSQKSKS